MIFYIFLGMLLALLCIAFGYWLESRKEKDPDVSDMFSLFRNHK